MIRWSIIVAMLAPVFAWPAIDGGLSGELGVHDPSKVVREKGRFHVFSTGPGIATRWSSNGLHWTRGQPVFAAAPSWTTNVVPGFRGFFWAPDVIHLNGRYHVYYSVSTFGKQVSAIGLVTNPTLDPNSPDFGWTDHGPVITSTNASRYNAIDPSLLLDRDGKLWMAFGSFWEGIFLVELDPKTGRRVAANSPVKNLARHQAIEAAGLHRRGDDYFLFVNWGICCRGTNSTYEVRVGRSSKITGPYLDTAGKDMVAGGGTLLLRAEGNDIGPGHVEVFQTEDRDWISYHVYDGTDRGRSKLRLRELNWTTNGWPTISAK